MGLDRLIVVGARGELGVEAKQGAAHAQDVLAAAVIYPTLQEFIGTEGEGVRIALSGKDARLKQPDELTATLRTALSQPEHRLRSANERVYLIFGPEDDGLSAEEMELCHFVCRLPTFGTITSMNLSHAVMMASYITRTELAAVEVASDTSVESAVTPVSDPRDMVHRWLEALGFDLSSPRINIEKTLNRILMSHCPSEEELRLLRTVLEQTIRKLKTPDKAEILINVDVDDLVRAEEFYTRAFGLRVGRRIGPAVVELVGFSSPIYLLQKERGSIPFKGSTQPRAYDRHWCPVHLDFVVDSIEEGVARAQAAGATIESDVRSLNWGKIAMGADPFGNGFCLVQFVGRGYDEVAER